MASGRNSSGDGELKRSVKRTEQRNSSTGFSPGRRSAIPDGMNKGKASKNPKIKLQGPQGDQKRGR